MKNTWFRTALFNFFLAACLGATLRLAFVVEIPWIKFRNVLHAHSHLAMLGWLYLALFSVLIHTFLDEASRRKKVYRWLFWLTQGCVIGMLISFPIQGYGPVSISFTTAHILLSYVFLYQFLRDARHSRSDSGALSMRLVRTSLGFMALSTLGVWATGPIMMAGFRGTDWYYLTVQFYLHFQFNGWFLFAILGLFFRILEENGLQVSDRRSRWFYGLLTAATFPTFALSAAWSNPLPVVFWINSLGVVIQLLALLVFLAILFPLRKELARILAGWSRVLLGIALAAFILKVLIQTSVTVPAIAVIAYTIRNYVIGFIHLMLLGAFSCFLFGFVILRQHPINQPRLGLILFITGLFASEILLLGQGTLLWARMGFMPWYYELLFGASALIPSGLFLLLAGTAQRGKAIPDIKVLSSRPQAGTKSHTI